MAHGVRRIVTGLDAEGRSTVLLDDRVGEAGFGLLWSSEAVPVDNSGREDVAAREVNVVDLMHSPGSVFFVSEMPVGMTAPMHATDTTDYVVILRGRIELQVETGVLELGPGDCVVDRGIVHGWRTLGDEPAQLLSVILPAAPVGAGGTM